MEAAIALRVGGERNYGSITGMRDRSVEIRFASPSQQRNKESSDEYHNILNLE